MKPHILKSMGVLAMLPSLIAAVVIAQQPAAYGPDWKWQTVNFFGQSVWVYGEQRDDGKIRYKRADVDRLIAPAELERRREASEAESEAKRKEAPPAALNYGVSVEQMATDGRIIRASDPETLAEVAAEAEKRKPCPDDSGGECRLGIVEKAENAIEKLIAYGVAAALVIAAAVVFFRSPRPPS
jgi:hypothetical protein